MGSKRNPENTRFATIWRAGQQKTAWFCLVTVLLGVSLASCATPLKVSGKGLLSTWSREAAESPPDPAAPARPQARPEASLDLPSWTGSTRDRMLETLQGLMGKKYNSKAVVAGRSFTLDCIGTIGAAWWGAGVDLAREYKSFKGNGVTMLWALLENRALLTLKPSPEPGDIVFWDNTWDANEDGIFGNDGHTHAGIVSRVGENGMVWYIHASVSRGVVEAYMNLDRPGVLKDEKGRYINSPMYLGAGEGKKGNPPRWLSGDLYSGGANARAMAAAFARPD